MSSSSKVVQIETKRTKNGQTLFTISRLARELRKDRKTVVKRLEGTPPGGIDARGYEGWTLDVAAPLILGAERHSTDPDKPLRPFDEDKHYSAQLKKLNLKRELGELVPLENIRREWSETLKRMVAWIQALPDQLERTAALTPAQVQKLEERVDELRGDLYAEIVRDDNDD